MDPDRNLSHTPPNGFNLPRRVRRLADLAYNLWWTWHPRMRAFSAPSRSDVWEGRAPQSGPITAQVPTESLRRPPRIAIPRVLRPRHASFRDKWRTARCLDPRVHPDRMNRPIAYFSTEFGLHESLPIYAGGLGVLSGDHLKEASDLGLPLVGVGFLYTQGYFRQQLDRRRLAGGAVRRRSTSPTCRSTRCSSADGEPLTITVDLPGRAVTRPAVARPGRAASRSILLDSDVEANQPDGPRTDVAPVHQRHWNCASRRRSCSASAACARCGRWATTRPSGT